jgi:hypothetical protein
LPGRDEIGSKVLLKLCKSRVVAVYKILFMNRDMAIINSLLIGKNDIIPNKHTERLQERKSGVQKLLTDLHEHHLEHDKSAGIAMKNKNQKQT